MADALPYARLLLLIAGIGLGAILASRVAAVVRIPRR